MDDQLIQDKPALWHTVQNKCREIGFDMPADEKTGSLLRTLVTSKASSNFLELGTGIGASLCWMMDGMDSESRLTSVDNDPELIEIVQGLFGNDPRLSLVCQDGAQWIEEYHGPGFDLIFADAWPGKYSQVESLLEKLNPGGLYLVDDMDPQANWPEGHKEHANDLVTFLDSRKHLVITKLNWSTGLIMATKRPA